MKNFNLVLNLIHTPMTIIWIPELRGWVIPLFLLITSCCCAQNTFFDQDFSSGGPYESGAPGSSLFDKILSTDAQSFAAYGPGYMDLVRTGNGGLIRAIRSTPFSPIPTTLYAQITMSVEEILSTGANAAYFYIGRDFRTDNSSIVPNDQLFSRFSLTFQDNSTFVVRDIQTNSNSAPMPLQSVFTITWVMNNSAEGHVYKMPESAATPDYKVMPGQYDLWIDNYRMLSGIPAYPGTSVKYHDAQLTNFEVKFWNALGRIRFYSFRIRDIAGVLPINGKPMKEASETGTFLTISPNPVVNGVIRLLYGGQEADNLQLYTQAGIPLFTDFVKHKGVLLMIPGSTLQGGLYILSYRQGGKVFRQKVIIP